jgi:hypothetical protein
MMDKSVRIPIDRRTGRSDQVRKDHAAGALPAKVDKLPSKHL